MISPVRPLHEVREVMGMPVTVHVEGSADSSWIEAVYEDFAHLDRLFSPFRPESEVCRINRGELATSAAGPLVAQAVDLCRMYEQSTAGFFSAWVGGQFDPSGLVKGWALDRAAGVLRGHCRGGFYVEAGGDVITRGRRADGSPWRVGIRHPVERDRVARVVLATDLAVATSGTYEKGAHIFDPHGGRPASFWISFTVVGPDILEADVLATAALAMGPLGLEFVERARRYEAYAIDRGLTAHLTSGFAALAG